MELTQSNEDYLEAIRRLCILHGSAQVRDIANLMNVKMPSVNSAVKSLSDLGLVEYVQYAPVKLTKEGEVLADKVIEKHKALRSFFKDVLELSHDRADDLACRLEHILNADEIEKFKHLVLAPSLPKS